MSQVLICDFCDKMIDERSQEGFCSFTIVLNIFQSEERLFQGHAHRECAPPKMLQLLAAAGKRYKGDDGGDIQRTEAPAPTAGRATAW